MRRQFPKIIYLLVCFMLIFEQSGFAQVAGQLDISGYFTGLRNVLIQDKFRPLHLRYLAYDNLSNNFKLILDKGDTKDLKEAGLKESTGELLKYFFTGVALSNSSFWVNLRPDSPDNIIDDYLAKTDVGKILLEADLQLKKDTAAFTSPQTPEGKKYWDSLYKKAGEIFGSENITIPTLTRPWIVPGEIIIRETQDNAYVYKATLKVMLEQDYLKGSATYNFSDERSKQLNEYASELIRKTIIPKLTKDINTAKRYAPLRQVYYSLILAHWFKQKFSGKSGLYSRLIDKNNLNGLTSKEPWSKDTYFQAYQKSFKEGEYNIREQVYALQGQTIRNYMSGGIAVGGDVIGEAINAGLKVSGNRRPIVALNNQIAGQLSPGIPQAPYSGELSIQSFTEKPIESASSPVTVREVNYSSRDISDKALSLKIHNKNKGTYISTGEWSHSSDLLKTFGAANCIVSLLIDSEGRQGIMGHYPYILSESSVKKLNKRFYEYIETVKSITNADTKYTLYLFGGAPIDHSENAISDAKKKKTLVRNAFKEVLGEHIDSIVDKTAVGFETIDWLIADIQNKEITYHYIRASSPAAVTALVRDQNQGSAVSSPVMGNIRTAAVLFLSLTIFDPQVLFGPGGIFGQRVNPETPQVTSVVPEPAVAARIKSGGSVFSLPSSDLFYILEWDGRFGVKTVFDFVFEEYQKNHPQVSKAEFNRKICSLKPQEIIRMAERYFQSHPGNQSNHFKREMENNIKIVTSARFRQTYQWAQQHLGLNSAKLSYYEIFSIFKNSELEIQRYINTLKSREFGEFFAFLKAQYGINPANQLTSVLEAYLNPSFQNRLRSAANQQAFRILKQYFGPLGVTMDNISFISVMNSAITINDKKDTNLERLLKSGEYEEKVKRAAQYYRNIRDNYGFRIETWRDLQELLMENKFLLESNEAINIWRYCQQRYPQRLLRFSGFSAFHSGVSGFYANIASHIIELGSTSEKLDAFLKIFGSDLGSADLGFIGQKIPKDFEVLTGNNEFHGFVSRLLDSYPQLREQMSSETISKIARAFAQERLFFELNQELAKFGKLSQPEFDLTNAGLKISILKKMGAMGFSRIGLFFDSSNSDATFFGGRYEESAMQELERDLSVGGSRAKRLYQALVNEWGMQRVFLSEFVKIYANAQQNGFYLNSDNARKFRELKEKYKLVEDVKKGVSLPIESTHDLTWVPSLVAEYDFLTGSGQELWKQYGTAFFGDRLGGAGETSVYVMTQFLSGYKNIRDPRFAGIAATLRSRYGFSDMEIIFFQAQGYAEGIERVLEDPNVQSLFQGMEQVYQRAEALGGAKAGGRYRNGEILERTLMVKDYAGALDTLHQLNKLGFNMTSWQEISYAKKFIFTESGVVANLNQGDFIEFFKKVAQDFYGGVPDLESLPEMSELYDNVMQQKESRDLLFSRKFTEAVSFIRTNFYIGELHASTLSPILRIAQNFDRETWEGLITKLRREGERVIANDLIFLNEILQDTQLQKSLFDRAGLIQELQARYAAEKASPRPSLDQVTTLEAELQYAQENNLGENHIAGIKAQIQNLKNVYTERPDLQSLSSLTLLRLKLLYRTLQDGRTLSALGQIVSADIADKRTEYGGTFRMSAGLLRPNGIKSHSEFDGAYSNQKYQFFYDGVVSFHLHALDLDNSQYSGPSGWLNSYGGDIPYVDLYDLTDIVITSMGHPRKADGTSDANKLIINADMYQVDKRDPGNKQLLIVDLGTFVVPYRDTAAKQEKAQAADTATVTKSASSPTTMIKTSVDYGTKLGVSKEANRAETKNISNKYIIEPFPGEKPRLFLIRLGKELGVSMSYLALAVRINRVNLYNFLRDDGKEELPSLEFCVRLGIVCGFNGVDYYWNEVALLMNGEFKPVSPKGKLMNLPSLRLNPGETPNAFIGRFIKESGLNPADVARALGIRWSSLHTIITARDTMQTPRLTKNYPTLKFMVRFVEVFGFNGIEGVNFYQRYIAPLKGDKRMLNLPALRRNIVSIDDKRIYKTIKAESSEASVSSSPVNDNPYSKIPVILPQIGSLVSEGTGYNSIVTWYSEGPSVEFPYGLVTKRLRSVQEAMREFSNLLEVSLSNSQFVQPVSLNGDSYTMEYLPGFSLQDVLDKKASLPEGISVLEDLASFARAMSHNAPERYIEPQLAEGVTGRFTLHRAINAAIEHFRGFMDRENVRAFIKQLLQMSQGKQTENMVFPNDIEPKNIRFTPRGIVMIDAGRDMQRATPIEFITAYWNPNIMQPIERTSSPALAVQSYDPRQLSVFNGEFNRFTNITAKNIVERLAGIIELRKDDSFRHVVTQLLKIKQDLMNPGEAWKIQYPSNCQLTSVKAVRVTARYHFSVELGEVKFPKEQYPELNIDKHMFTRTRLGGREVIVDISADQFEPLGDNRFADLGVVVIPLEVVNAHPERFWMYTGNKPHASSPSAMRKSNISSLVRDVQMIKALKEIDGLEVKKNGEVYKFEVRNRDNENWDRVVVLKNARGEEVGFFELSTKSIVGYPNARYIRITNESYLGRGFARLILDEVRKMFPDAKTITTEIASKESLQELEEGTPLASTGIVRLFESAGWKFIDGGYYDGNGDYHKEPFDEIMSDDIHKGEEGFVAAVFEVEGIQPNLPWIEDEEISSSPVGGIDFRAMPVVAQRVSSLPLDNAPTAMSLARINLDESLVQIQNMLNAGIIPSSERIREYLQSCYGRKDMGQDIDKILACITDILRIQEDRAISTDVSLKEMLALLESGKPANEMQFVLAKITVPEREVFAIKPQ